MDAEHRSRNTRRLAYPSDRQSHPGHRHYPEKRMAAWQSGQRAALRERRICKAGRLHNQNDKNRSKAKRSKLLGLAEFADTSARGEDISSMEHRKNSHPGGILLGSRITPRRNQSGNRIQIPNIYTVKIIHRTGKGCGKCKNQTKQPNSRL